MHPRGWSVNIVALHNSRCRQPVIDSVQSVQPHGCAGVPVECWLTICIAMHDVIIVGGILVCAVSISITSYWLQRCCIAVAIAWSNRVCIANSARPIMPIIIVDIIVTSYLILLPIHLRPYVISIIPV